MSSQLNNFEDSATEDLREENKFLRQELFLLCERIQENDYWRNSRSEIKETSSTLEHSCKISSCADNEGIDSKLSVLETEIVQIRLTNFELVQKIKELEILRLKAQDDANRMQREIQRLVPHASNCATLQRMVSENNEKWLHFRLAQRASQRYWERLELVHYRQTAQITMLQKSEIDLNIQLKRANALQQEKLSTTARLMHELEAAKIEIVEAKSRSQILQQENDSLLSEVNRVQSLCHSQAKELDRLHNCQAQLLELQNRFKYEDEINTSTSESCSIDKNHAQNSKLLSLRRQNTFNHNSLESAKIEKSKHPVDQQQCGFFCVPL